jgi:indolepyruvate ferredoxin oxidoreductase alpha subunit
MLAVPSNVIRCHRELNAKYEEVKSWSGSSGLIQASRNGQRRGIIASGLAYNYARESGMDAALLKVSFYPYPESILENFVKGLDEVWVLEEGEPLIEEMARKFSANVKGKLTGELSAVGELGPDALLKQISDTHAGARVTSPQDLPLRPPVMCQGCPHRELYKALIAAQPTFTAGDIGCYTLGASPPLRAMDTCLCMGASISKAAGISKQGVKRVTAIIGDSTFLHSGIPALISAVYNRANIVVIIMDNASTAMTGHQPTPLTGITAKGDQGGRISLEELCKACGAASVEVLDPFNAEHTERILRENLGADGVHVVISRKPCVLVGRRKKK